MRMLILRILRPIMSSPTWWIFNEIDIVKLNRVIIVRHTRCSSWTPVPHHNRTRWISLKFHRKPSSDSLSSRKNPRRWRKSCLHTHQRMLRDIRRSADVILSHILCSSYERRTACKCANTPCRCRPPWRSRCRTRSRICCSGGADCWSRWGSRSRSGPCTSRRSSGTSGSDHCRRTRLEGIWIKKLVLNDGRRGS